MGGVKCQPSQHHPIDDPGKYEMKRSAFAVLASLTGVSACTIAPTVPSVMALPGTGKTFDQFRIDDGSCRQFASEQVGGVSANKAATTSAVGSAVVGTALGAAAGAASGAWIALHPADAALIPDRYDDPTDLLIRVAGYLRRMGAPAAEIEGLVALGLSCGIVGCRLRKGRNEIDDRHVAELGERRVGRRFRRGRRGGRRARCLPRRALRERGRTECCDGCA